VGLEGSESLELHRSAMGTDREFGATALGLYIQPASLPTSNLHPMQADMTRATSVDVDVDPQEAHFKSSVL
jgi:hypothetical protein